MQIIIDRIEGIFAVVELQDGNTIEVPIELLPENIKEGNIIEIKINNDITEKRRKTIEEKFNSLLED